MAAEEDNPTRRRAKCPRTVVRKNAEGNAVKTYRRGECLGKGAFATVYSMKEADNAKVVAAKVVEKSRIAPGDREKLREEMRVHSSLLHAHIVQFYGSFEDANHLFLLLERADTDGARAVQKLRGSLPEKEFAAYLRQILSAVSHMHDNLVIHRDLKLSNVFLSYRGQAKVGDFGLACKVAHPEQRLRGVMGTPNYIAPETLAGKNGCGHSFEVDVWSLGVMAFVALTGTAPFRAKDVASTHERVKANDWVFPSKPHLSSEAKAFIERCLVSDPFERASVGQLLCHSYVQDEFTFSETSASEKRDERTDDVEERPLLTAPARTPLAPLDGNANAAKDAKGKEESSDTREYAPREVSKGSEKGSSSAAQAKGMEELDMAKEGSQEVGGWPAGFPRVWVARWVDMTSKYGLGYMLSDGTVGAVFNDGTRGVLLSGGRVEYKGRREREEGSSVWHPEDDGAPRSLGKKKRLLGHFEHLMARVGPRVEVSGRGELGTAEGPSRGNGCVKRWFREGGVVVFRLSTRAVQVAFPDGSEVVLSSEVHWAIYRASRDSPRRAFPLADLPQDDSLLSRLRHARRLLSRFVAKE